MNEIVLKGARDSTRKPPYRGVTVFVPERCTEK